MLPNFKFHTLFSKLYATVLHQWFAEELEKRHLRARGQSDFYPNYQMIDHIFTVRAIIEEARRCSSKVYACFVDIQKAFDTVPRDALFQRLYESVSRCLKMAHGLSNFI
jgi:hypothetical protein